MELLEIVLLVGGLLCIVASFLVGEKEIESAPNYEAGSNELTEQDKEHIRKQIDELIEERISDVSERTEAKLDKISNTKILEMNDYAETIMGEINRNHNETVFLYDMLNEKAKEVKSTVKDVNVAKKEVAQMQHGSGSVAPAQPVSESKKQTEFLSEDKASGVSSEVTVAETQDTPSTLVATDVKDAKQANGSKDLAKERLIELVKKSTERSREMQAEAQAKVYSAKLEAETEIKPVKATKKKAATKTTAKATTKTTAQADVESEVKSDDKSKSDDKPVAKKTTKKSTKKVSAEDKLQEEIAKIKSDSGASKNDIIIAIHKLGMSNKDIAKELNLGIGEVKLVIDLYSSAK